MIGWDVVRGLPRAKMVVGVWGTVLVEKTIAYSKVGEPPLLNIIIAVQRAYLPFLKMLFLST